MGTFRAHIERQIPTMPVDVAIAQINTPFRFSTPERMRLMGALGPEKHLRTSQQGTHLWRTLEYADYILGQESREDAGSKLRIIHAAALLPNMAWHEGPHLGSVVRLAGELLAHKNPQLAQESAAQALKSAAWIHGSHVPEAVNIAVEHGFSSVHNASDRIINDLVRTVLYATRHYPEYTLQVDEVEGFLKSAIAHKNPVIAGHARSALETISNYAK